MSPDSPVFHTVVTVRISLKTQLDWEHLINKNNKSNQQFNSYVASCLAFCNFRICDKVFPLLND